MNGIEREILKTTSYKVLRKFDDRQDYLLSLLNATEKLSDDDFDNLSIEAADWINAAVEAHNSKHQDIPDFDEVPPENDPDDEGADDSEESNDDDSSGNDQPIGDEVEAEPTEVEAVGGTDEAETETEEKPAKRGKPRKPPKAKPAKVSKAKAELDALKEPTPAKPKVDLLKRGSDEDVVLDKWGAMEGSKNSRALALFEKGATIREVKEKLDGTFYNILKRAVEAGHSVEKEGSLITLTHRDNIRRGKK